MPEYKGVPCNYEHDSDCCSFLGTYHIASEWYNGWYDLYHCSYESRTGTNHTVLARYGDEGWQYYSNITHALKDRNLPLWEAVKRAVAMGHMTQEDWDRSG